MSNILNRYRNGEKNIIIEGEDLKVCRQLTGLKGNQFFGVGQVPDRKT